MKTYRNFINEISEKEIENLIARYKKTGRTAFYYPKKNQISVDGRSMKAKDAIEKMKRILKESSSGSSSDLYFYISSGGTNAQYTLRCRKEASYDSIIGTQKNINNEDKYIMNLGCNRDAAFRKAKEYIESFQTENENQKVFFNGIIMNPVNGYKKRSTENQ